MNKVGDPIQIISRKTLEMYRDHLLLTPDKISLDSKRSRLALKLILEIIYCVATLSH